MKATVKLENVVVEVEGDNQAELFQEIASCQEVFGETKCMFVNQKGERCESTNIIFKVRDVDDSKFHEIVCQKCGAYLAFGQNKKGGGLFPIRHLTKEGKPHRAEGTFDVKSRGWTKYRPKKPETEK